MLMKTIDLSKITPNLKELVSWVVNGAEVVFTENDKPVAHLIPMLPRVPGLHAGGIWASDDFDASLPDEFWVGQA
jgi:antitoxin (DNA-binding transcriptional repressor) of toxin-antitoxin stability system